MWFPMAILSIGSVTAGYLFTRGEALSNWLSPLFHEHHEETLTYSKTLVSSLALLAVAIGVAIAILKYQKNELADVAPENVSFFTRIARRDLLQDDFNEAVFMRPGQKLTSVLVKTDDVAVDGAVRGIGRLALGSGKVLRITQTGFARSYAALIIIGAIALMAAIWVVTA